MAKDCSELASYLSHQRRGLRGGVSSVSATVPLGCGRQQQGIFKLSSDLAAKGVVSEGGPLPNSAMSDLTGPRAVKERATTPRRVHLGEVVKSLDSSKGF